MNENPPLAYGYRLGRLFLEAFIYRDEEWPKPWSIESLASFDGLRSMDVWYIAEGADELLHQYRVLSVRRGSGPDGLDVCSEGFSRWTIKDKSGSGTVGCGDKFRVCWLRGYQLDFLFRNFSSDSRARVQTVMDWWLSWKEDAARLGLRDIEMVDQAVLRHAKRVRGS